MAESSGAGDGGAAASPASPSVSSLLFTISFGGKICLLNFAFHNRIIVQERGAAIDECDYQTDPTVRASHTRC